jgi:hypothetical protein
LPGPTAATALSRASSTTTRFSTASLASQPNNPSLLGRFWLRRTLEAMPGYRFHRVGSLEVLPQLELKSFQAMALYIHHKTISASALESLDDFVRRGGGLLAIHSASASFKQEARYFQILGGRFVGHGPVEAFQLQPAAPQAGRRSGRSATRPASCCWT